LTLPLFESTHDRPPLQSLFAVGSRPRPSCSGTRSSTASLTATPSGTCGTAPIVDIGAHECQRGCPGDLDGATDVADLGILLADFGCAAPGPCAGELDGDGDTDLADLGILVADSGCAP
jgi:hypothetical protein